MVLSALQVLASTYIGRFDADSLITSYKAINDKCKSSECYKGELDKLVSEEKNKQLRWDDYLGVKNWIFAFIRLFVLNIAAGLFFSILYSKNYLTELQSRKIKKLLAIVIFSVFISAFYLLGLGLNTDINGSVFNTYPKNLSEILLLLISLFTAIVSAYFSSVGDILGHNFFPRFLLRNNVKKSDTEKRINQNINKNDGKLRGFAKLTENKWVQVVTIISIFGLSFAMMSKVNLPTADPIESVWDTLIEVVYNFLPSAYIIITILVMQIYNHRYHLYDDKLFKIKICKSYVAYGIIGFVFIFLYIFTASIKYGDKPFFVSALLFFLSIVVGTFGLSFLDIRFREWKPLHYALKANALPIGSIGRFKTYLVELIDVSIDPIIKDLLNLAVESSETKVNYDVYLSLISQKFIAIEIVDYLENPFISQGKFNTGKFITEYNVLIHDIDSAMQQFLISNDDNTLKAIASAHRLNVLTKELKELLDFT